jgi:hypothetical protein
MPPRTAIQARRSLGANPVPSRSGGSYGGGEDFGSPYKDEDKKYTPPGSRDEGNVNYGGGSSENRSGENLSEKEKNELWNKAQTLDEINKEKEKTGIQKFYDFAFGAEGDTSVKKSAFEKSGKHPLRAQLDYLIAKYGDDVVNTEQGKVLMGYLAGVPVERGGGLGAQDENYGLTGDEADEFQSKLLLDEDFMDGQNYRNSLLRQVAGMTNTMGGQFDFSNIDPERASQGLSPEQYYNFRQQLMAADATPENQQYKSAFPFSSGSGLESLSRFIPGIGTLQTLTGGILPERNMAGYQGTNDPFAATFKALPQSQSSSSGVMSMPAFATAPGQDAPPKPGPKPDAPSGPSFTPQDTSPFDLSQFYAGLPSYSYGQQGVMNPNINPDLAAYFENLKKYYGVG